MEYNCCKCNYLNSLPPVDNIYFGSIQECEKCSEVNIVLNSNFEEQKVSKDDNV